MVWINADGSITSDAAQKASQKVTCGTCELHGSNVYGEGKPAGIVFAQHRNDCCADIAMDLPDSWNNQTSMDPVKERYCPIWRAVPNPEIAT